MANKYTFHETANKLCRGSDISTLRLANDLYDVHIYYFGDYAKDKQENAIDPASITVSARCKDSKGAMPLGYDQGLVNIDTSEIMPMLNAVEARALAQALIDAAGSAEALQEAIGAYF